MNQIARRFPSNDADGEAEYTQPPFSISSYLNGAPYWDRDIFTGYDANGISQSNFDIIAHYCMKNCIRLTAGLIYWFTVNTHQTAFAPPNITNITKNKPNDKIFWNENLRYTPIVTGTQPIQYNWEWRKCGSYNSGCQNSVPFPNTIEFTGGENANFYNSYSHNGYTYNCSNNPQNCYQTTPCSINNQYPNCGTGNIYYTLKLTCWNDWGSSSFQIPDNITPWATFRPPPSGGGGCPYVYVWNSDSTLYMTDNNLLHRSEFADFANQDITDKYKLLVQPNLNKENIQFKLVNMKMTMIILIL